VHRVDDLNAMYEHRCWRAKEGTLPPDRCTWTVSIHTISSQDLTGQLQGSQSVFEASFPWRRLV
jgi:hypothetical protein